MMKRKFLAVILPIIGCATVVGSGFSAWYFGATASTSGEGINIGTHVTEEINSVVGTLSIPSGNSNASTLNGMNLILDQGGFKNTNDNQGIMFANGTPSDVSAKDLEYKFNVVFDGRNADLTLEDVYNAGMELKVTVSFDLGGALSQYIAVKAGAGMVVDAGPAGDADELKFTKGTDNNVYTATYTLKETSLAQIGDLVEYAEFTFKIDLSTNASFENSLFVYGGPGKKPTTSQALKRMRAVLNEQKITFSTVATIK